MVGLERSVFFYCCPYSYKEHIFSSLYSQKKNVPEAIFPLKINGQRPLFQCKRPCRHPWAPLGLSGLLKEDTPGPSHGEGVGAACR